MQPQVIISVGGGGICFILAWVSFVLYDDSRTGWIFVAIGLVVFLLGLVLGKSKE